MSSMAATARPSYALNETLLQQAQQGVVHCRMTSLNRTGYGVDGLPLGESAMNLVAQRTHSGEYLFPQFQHLLAANSFSSGSDGQPQNSSRMSSGSNHSVNVVSG
jgi:hypothetical protein